MDRSERFYGILRLLAQQRGVNTKQFLEVLEVSPATLKRDIQYLRDRFQVPIVWRPDLGAYVLNRSEGAQSELPGMWFSDKEIHALLTMQHLLANLDPGGLLAPHVEPLVRRLDQLLGAANDVAEEVRRRVVIVGVGKRNLKLAHFERVGSALLRRKRLSIRYFARGKGEEMERQISPQRLVHYRENWYLDAWCHVRCALRSFAVDSIYSVELLEAPAQEVPETSIDAVLGPGYGIFSGSEIRWAMLRFSPERARWVASEFWHTNQRSRFDPDGSYLLEIPFTDHRELLMDVLKHGTHCQVIAPDELRETVRQTLLGMLAKYPLTPPQDHLVSYLRHQNDGIA